MIFRFIRSIFDKPYRKLSQELVERERNVSTAEFELKKREEIVARTQAELDARVQADQHEGFKISFDFEAFKAVSIERAVHGAGECTIIGFTKNMNPGPMKPSKDNGHPFYFYAKCSRRQHNDLVNEFNEYIKKKKTRHDY